MPVAYMHFGGHDLTRPMLMDPGTCAVDPSEYGSLGRVNTYVLASGDVAGTRFLYDKCEDGCIGISAWTEPNLACVGCGAGVAWRTDACGGWQATRLDPSAVCSVSVSVPERSALATAATPGIVPFAWEAASVGFLGAGPGDGSFERDRLLWYERVVACIARLLAASAGGPVLAVGPTARLLASMCASTLEGAGHQGAFQRVEHVRAAGDLGVRRLLAPAEGQEAIRTLSLWSAEASPAPMIRAATWLRDRISQLGVPAPTIALNSVVPVAADASDPTAEDGIRTIRDGWTVNLVPMDEPVWRYLSRVGGADRLLAGTRWHGRGVREEFYRDDLPYGDLIPLDATDIVYRFESMAFYQLARLLAQQPQSTEPWLATVIDKLLHPYR